MNIVLINIDALRQDRVDCYSNNNLTPSIKEISKGGIVFENAFTVSNISNPSNCSILTGCYPTTHGVRKNGWKLKDMPTIASVLKENGYITVAAVSGRTISPVYGLGKGFDRFYTVSKMDRMMYYFSKIGYGRFTLNKAFRYIKFFDLLTRESKETNKVVFDWLDKNHDKKFFLFVQYEDIHIDTFGKKKTLKDKMDNYDENVKIIDSAIKGVVDKLKEHNIFDDTLIVIFSDHGDSLGEALKLGHGWQINDSEFKVPLIMYKKDVLFPKRVESLARTIDIMPTILDLLKIPVYFGMDGTSLLGSISDEKKCCEEVFMEANPDFVDLKGVKTNNFTYILQDGAKGKLIDGSGRETSEENKEVALQLRVKLKKHFNVSYEEQEIDAYTGKVLEDLGYKKD